MILVVLFIVCRADRPSNTQCPRLHYRGSSQCGSTFDNITRVLVNIDKVFRFLFLLMLFKFNFYVRFKYHICSFFVHGAKYLIRNTYYITFYVISYFIIKYIFL